MPYDRALELPPLNRNLSQAMIARTRAARLLAGYRDRPAANLDAIAGVLESLADLLADFPEVQEVDINPLWANETGVLALDARIRLEAPLSKGVERFAIRPFPLELARPLKDRYGEPWRCRPIRPEDARRLQATIARTNPDDIRLRFFSALQELPDQLAARLSQLDYDREMAFVVEDPETEAFVCVGRLSHAPDRSWTEYAILVRSDRKGLGLGYAMMNRLIDHAREEGIPEVRGEVLRENKKMRSLAANLGFTERAGPSSDLVEVVYRFAAAATADA